MQAKRKNGFTLIELVIVIAILGILAGLAIPRFLDSRAQAEGAKLLGDLCTIDSPFQFIRPEQVPIRKA